MNAWKGNFEEEALAIAAACWTDKETEKIAMNEALAKAFAKRIEFWIDAAAQNERNTQFYRDLLDECAKAIGKEAYTNDDGEIMQDPVRIKIPELVKKMIKTKGANKIA